MGIDSAAIRDDAGHLHLPGAGITWKIPPFHRTNDLYPPHHLVRVGIDESIHLAALMGTESLTVRRRHQSGNLPDTLSVRITALREAQMGLLADVPGMYGHYDTIGMGPTENHQEPHPRPLHPERSSPPRSLPKGRGE